MDGWKIALIVVALKLVLLAFCLGYRYKKRQVYEKQRLDEEANVQNANQQIGPNASTSQQLMTMTQHP